MKARAVARELALISFSWLNKEVIKLENITLDEIILNSVRTLKSHAENELQIALSGIMEIKDYLQDYEVEHPANAKGSVDSLVKPVTIPLTSDMIGRIDSLITVADKAFNALDLTEIAALSNTHGVKQFINGIVTEFVEHHVQVDRQISKNSKGWGIDRLVKMDRDILRIAITELLYLDDIPVAVTIDEAVELAKKYSTEESSAFINGILREVVKDNNIVKVRQISHSKKQEKTS